MSARSDSAPHRVAQPPRATYRLQFNHTFKFVDAARIVPYLARLGISHVYSSPILKARPGSMHGYDVTDHNQLNPELGTREDFDRFADVLRDHGMGLIVDIVPNHLGVMGDDNAWWLDMLENGPAGRCASHFDVDWRPNRAAMRDRVLVPVLGEPYGTVLEKGDLRLSFDAATGSFGVSYFEHRMPIDPREYPRIFVKPIPEALLAPDDPHRADFESLLNAFGNLPPRNDTSEEAVAIRYRDKEAHKRRLVRLIERSPEVLEYIRRTLIDVNGTPGVAATFDALEALLEAQAYRLSYWRVAVDEINYRRFFDINDLAALRMNERAVFDSTHRLIFELIDAGRIQGLRIDHSDGLYDPETYFDWLQRRIDPQDDIGTPLYVVTEKILASHERLSEHWRVNGTTGYEFATLATSWLVDGENEARMTRRYRQFTETEAAFDEIAYDGKRLVMRTSLAAEVEVLATQLDRIAQLDRHTADFTRAAIREAIREVIACFPVYRTYISARGTTDEDRRIVNWAVSVARKRSAGVELTVFDLLRDVLLGDASTGRTPAQVQAMLEFSMKFQQVTAPVTAKGVEDTAFYRYNRLVCLNEVGGDPRRFSASSAAVHQANLERARSWPDSMLGTSTHDTKRSEDVRARIAVLSELPDEWKRYLARWARLNRSKRRQLEEGAAPDREDEYLVYQTLVGVWPEDLQSLPSVAERVKEYAIKAAREAKRATSWISPNAAYEEGLTGFVAQLLDRPERNAFVRDFEPLARTVAWFGRINSLAQTALKVASPGVPDFYQGTEHVALTLVDPDNRGPVDFEAAARRFDEVARFKGPPRELFDAGQAHEKLYVTARMLELRRRDPELFARGSYVPLQVEGGHKEHVLAFARVLGTRAVVIVIPRWSGRLMQGSPALPIGPVWGDTSIHLPADVPAALTELFTGRRSPAGMVWQVVELLSDFPIAVYGA